MTGGGVRSRSTGLQEDPSDAPRSLRARVALGFGGALVGVVWLALTGQETRWVGLVPLAALAGLVGPVRGRGLGLGTWTMGGVVGFGVLQSLLLTVCAAAWRQVLAPRGEVERSEVLGRLAILTAAGTAAGVSGGRFDVWGASVAWMVVLVAAAHWTKRPLLPVALDGVGWVFGVFVWRWAGLLERADFAVLVGCVSFLCGEIARQSAHGRVTRARVGSLERLREAHVRILGETSGFGGIAAQIWIECRNVLPVRWMELRRVETGEVWSVGPEGELREVHASPPRWPPALPGIHRRAGWRILEHSLEAEQRRLAELRLWCDPRQVDAGAEDLLRSLLPQMASAVHRSELDREARLDPLTEIPVRRILDRELQRAFAGVCEAGGSMAVILCDVDHFKRVNDTWGHPMGDEVLRGVARALDQERRENDLLCRYGGEEFTLLLEETDGEAALGLADRLRRAVAGLAWELEDGTQLRVTLSAGVAAFPELLVQTGSELLLLADEALYRAKEDGRDRCRLRVGREAYRGVEEPHAPPAAPEVPRFFA